MAKVYKDLKVTWNWTGDKYDLRGFNVAIVPQGGDPKNDAVVIQQTGKENFEHSFRNLFLNDTETYVAWVQAIYPNEDSNWFSQTNLTVSDDGSATVETTNGASNKAQTAENNAKEYTDDLETSLGNLAFDNLVEDAKLGSTIIDGGYIKSDLLTADNILTGTLGANRVQIGGGTTYESDYDPSTKETPTGAQSKASQAEQNAKGYADDDAKWVSANSRKDANISSAGWYRIAINRGDRANATFKLRDTESGQHNTVEFKLGCSYNKVSTADFQMTSFSRYGSLTFSKVRLLTNGTYDEMYVEVYLESSADVRCEITDNIQNHGWNPVDWSSGSIPSGYSSTEWDIDVNTITIDGNGIKTTGSNGDYSLLDSDQLAFYKAGSSKPHWYSKRVAYGTAQDGDYVELNWDKPPKVITAIKSLRSYTYKDKQGNTFENFNQMYESYADSITSDGFYAYGHSIIPSSLSENLGSDEQHAWEDGDTRLNGYTWVSQLSSPQNNTAKLICPFSIRLRESGGGLGYDVDIYYQEASSDWVHYKNYRYYGYFSGGNVRYDYSFMLSNLPVGKYRVKFVINSAHVSEAGGGVYFYFGKDNEGRDGIIATGDQVIDDGEVMWIAIEGGAN